MLNKSIAYRLSIYISIAVISVFIAFIGIYILFQKALLKENIQNEAISLSSEVSSIVGRYVVVTKEVTANIADQIVFYGQQNHPDIFLESLIKRYSFINAIHVNIDTLVNDIAFRNYYCFQHNDTVHFIQQNNRIETCTSSKEIVAKLTANKKPTWSEPIKCIRNNQLVVSYYVPIVHNGRIAGEVICELSLLELNDTINSVKTGKRGMAFLLSKEGTYLTHPNKDWILNRNAYTISDKIYDKSKIDVKNILENGMEGYMIAYPEYLDFEKSWIFHSPISDSNWTLVFALPYNELFEPLYLPILQMLFFSVLGILIIYLLVTYISNKLIQPLSYLTQQLKKFSSSTGDMSTISENEIRQVAESLDYMQWWYEKYKINKLEEVKESKTRIRDINQASEIQRSFIKMNFPAFPDRNDIDLYATYKPARGVSGDLFDYFFIDEHHLIFTMGDVSGKGVPAALFMSVAQSVIKKNSNYISAKKIIEKASKELYTNNQHQFFLTLFLGVLNVETGELTYCNAAHTASYILNNNRKLIKLSDSHGLPLGLYPDKKYGETKIHVNNGSSIVVYTDGVTELQDENNLQYGNQKLEENLQNLTEMNPKEMIVKIEKSLQLFIGETKQSDDISMLILKYKP